MIAADRVKRDWQIYRDWRRGADVARLAAQHRLTVTRVRQICASEKLRRQRKPTKRKRNGRR